MIENRTVQEILSNLVLPFKDGGGNIIEKYHKIFINRYVNSLNELICIDRKAKVLELGANPYGMTAVMASMMFEDISISSFGRTGEQEIVELKVFNKSYYFDEKKFNLELDTWPYADEEFDLVICCEIIEHLAMDPMHVFFEANRVLKKDGVLFITTPNSSSIQNIIKAVALKAPSMAPHYRGPRSLTGIYQRHNREFTPPALAECFASGGFNEILYRTVYNYPLDTCGVDESKIDLLRSLTRSSFRGDTLNYLGRKVSIPLLRYPTDQELYISSDLRD